MDTYTLKGSLPSGGTSAAVRWHLYAPQVEFGKPSSIPPAETFDYMNVLPKREQRVPVRGEPSQIVVDHTNEDPQYWEKILSECKDEAHERECKQAAQFYEKTHAETKKKLQQATEHIDTLKASLLFSDDAQVHREIKAFEFAKDLLWRYAESLRVNTEHFHPSAKTEGAEFRGPEIRGIVFKKAKGVHPLEELDESNESESDEQEEKSFRQSNDANYSCYSESSKGSGYSTYSDDDLTDSRPLRETPTISYRGVRDTKNHEDLKQERENIWKKYAPFRARCDIQCMTWEDTLAELRKEKDVQTDALRFEAIFSAGKIAAMNMSAEEITVSSLRSRMTRSKQAAQQAAKEYDDEKKGGHPLYRRALDMLSAEEAFEHIRPGGCSVVVMLNGPILKRLGPENLKRRRSRDCS